MIIFEQSETIPQGTYNLDNITFSGVYQTPWRASAAQITFGANTNVSSWKNAVLTNAVALINRDDPLITYNGADQFVLDMREGAIAATYDSPMFVFENQGVNNVIRLTTNAVLFNGEEPLLDDGGPLPNLGNTEIISLANAFSFCIIVQANGTTTVTNDVIEDTATGQGFYGIITYDPSVSRATVTNTNFSGQDFTVNYSLNGVESRDLSYTVGNAGDWPTQPQSTGDAIDKLAARIAALEP